MLRPTQQWWCCISVHLKPERNEQDATLLSMVRPEGVWGKRAQGGERRKWGWGGVQGVLEQVTLLLQGYSRSYK